MCSRGLPAREQTPKEGAYTLYIYVINESGQGDDRKTVWNRCGAAFSNQDGSITLKFGLLPHVGIQVREQMG